MAKNKAQNEAPSMGGATRINTNIESAENGFIVRASADEEKPNGKHVMKTYVAPDHASALRIASTHIAGCGPKGKGAKGKGRKGKNKIATSKRG
jgi:hypothetical protein